jgi:hypothetical protein
MRLVSVLSVESKTTKTRAGSAGGQPFAAERASNYMHVFYIAKPGRKVNGYFQAKLCDSRDLEPFRGTREKGFS